MEGTSHQIHDEARAVRIHGQCHAVWNLFVAENGERYKAEDRFVFCAAMSAQLGAAFIGSRIR